MTSLDIYAEQGVLAGIIEDPDLIDQVAEIITATDFNEPRHEAIFDALISLRNEGKHVDLVTLGARLKDVASLDKIGGIEYLSTLTDPGAVFAEDADPVSYAMIVAEESRWRQFSRVARDMQNLRSAGNISVNDAIASGEAMIRSLMDKSNKTEAQYIEDMFDDAIGNIERRAQGISTGIPSGFVDLDSRTTGFHPGQFIIVAARPAVGKALALDTIVHTPAGMLKIGDLSVGDVVYAWDSSLAHIINVTDTLLNEECYRIEYEGASIVADANHEFPVLTNVLGSEKVIITVSQMYKLYENGVNLRFPQMSIPHSSLTDFTDNEVVKIASRVLEKKIGTRASALTRAVILYMFAGKKAIHLSETVAAEVYDMALSVGISVKRHNDMVLLTNEIGREILSITSIKSVPVRCIEVDHPDHLYLCGGWVVSHNSTLAMDFARAASLKAGKTVLMFSLEMSKEELMDRLLSAESNVELQHIRKGTLSEREWSAVHTAIERTKNANLVFDDSPNVTVEHIRSVSLRQAATPQGLDEVIVDYLQLMRSVRRPESRQQEVSEISRSLKLLAKELSIPVIGICQLNRGPEGRADKRPVMSDLRESGSLEQDADIVILLHRPAEEAASAERTTAILDKNRNGPTGDIPLAPLLAYAKFANGTGLFPTDAPPDDYVPPPDTINEGYAAPQTEDSPAKLDSNEEQNGIW